MPLRLQRFVSSSSIGREAVARSVSPAQKRSKPPPVPETPTVIWTFECSRWNRSAAAVANGLTVLEPSASMRPDRPPPPSASFPPPHPVAATSTAATATAESNPVNALTIPRPIVQRRGDSVGRDDVNGW